MKVFVLSVEDVYEGDSISPMPRVFSTFESAKKAFNDTIDDFKLRNNVANLIQNYEHYVEEIGNSCYRFYEDGYYCQNHYDVIINKVELEN